MVRIPQNDHIINDNLMARLAILEFPDPRLRTAAKPVAEVTDETRQIIDDMFETMYAAPVLVWQRHR